MCFFFLRLNSIQKRKKGYNITKVILNNSNCQSVKNFDLNFLLRFAHVVFSTHHPQRSPSLSCHRPPSERSSCIYPAWLGHCALGHLCRWTCPWACWLGCWPPQHNRHDLGTPGWGLRFSNCYERWPRDLQWAALWWNRRLKKNTHTHKLREIYKR